MKELLNEVNNTLKPLGYKKRGTSFWKVEYGFYKLIDFQKGAHGGDYFFVNVCVHPVGLPQLLVNKLSIPEQPKEYECILRQRIEQVSQNEYIAAFKRGFVSVENVEVTKAIIKVLNDDVEKWMKIWGSYEKLANVNCDDVINMLTVVPILKTKALAMLRFYCTLIVSDKNKAIEILEEYLKTEVKGLSFPQVDNYLKKLVE